MAHPATVIFIQQLAADLFESVDVDTTFWHCNHPYLMSYIVYNTTPIVYFQYDKCNFFIKLFGKITLSVIILLEG